jgi:hypothetical protein
MSPAAPRRRTDVLRRCTDATVVLTRGDAEVARWRLAGCDRPDVALIDQLARLQLAAGRVGYAIRLRNTCAELVELLDLLGLTKVLAGAAGLRQAGGEAEGGEQVGIEEVVVPDDPVT